jgi:serine protease Do
MIKQIATLVLFSTMIGQTQVKSQEVKIEKKIVTKNSPQKIDTSINLTILIDGDKVIINGKEADKNDPRLKKLGKMRIITNDHNAQSADTLDELNELEGLDNIMGDNQFNIMAPPPQPMPNKAFLGVISAENKLGAIVNEVSEGSPAEKAGLKKDDIITKLNETSIESPKDLYEAVGKLKPEDKVTINYLRAGKALKLTTQLAKNKNTPNARYFNFNIPGDIDSPNFRNRMGDKNFNFRMPNMPEMDGIIGDMKKPKLGISIEDLASNEGVKVKAVVPGSPAEKAGFKVNDIIVSLDKSEVKEVTDLKWEYFEAGQVLKFGIKRDGQAKTIEVKLPKKLKTADL